MAYMIILGVILLCSAFAVAFESKAIINQNEKMLSVAPISLFVILLITIVMFIIFKANSPTTFAEEFINVFTNIMFTIDFVMVGIQFLLMCGCTIVEKKKIQKNRVQK